MILGGKDKGSDYAPLRRESARSARSLALLIGSAAEKIAGQIAGSVRSSAPGRWSAPWTLRDANARAGRHRFAGAGLRQLRSI